MREAAGRHRQQGAVIITVALLTLFLLGFIGFALDFGRLFIVKSELQTAMDSCALAAAQELDLQPTAIQRATNAGLTAGNMNRVNLQSPTWGGDQAQACSVSAVAPCLTAAEITFKDPSYLETTNPALAKYSQCELVQSGVRMWLMQALGAFTGNTTTFPATRNVMASAVATRATAQSTCPIPVALRPKTAGAPGPDYGYTPGEWITLLMSPSTGENGYMGWANLDGTNSASETIDEMNGACGVRIGDDLGTPGVQAAVALVWNERFGIYRNNGDPAIQHPDLSGYAYTTDNWPPRADGTPPNAYNGTPPPGAHATAENFATKRQTFASCPNTGTSIVDCRSIINRTLASFQKTASPAEHQQHGTNRRIVLVPVTTSFPGAVEDYACMLMLQPLNFPPTDVQLEYIGNAGLLNSPCTTSGMPGGSAGPLVPALVR